MKNRAFVRVAVLLGNAVALTWALPASAQEFLKDRAIAEGSGYSSGAIDFHPGIAAEIGYESNYFDRSDKTNGSYVNAAPTNPPEGSAIVRVTPSITMETVNATPGRNDAGATAPPPLRFSGSLSGTYKEFLNPAMSNQRNMSAAATALLGVHQGHPLSLTFTAAWNRMIQPTVLGDPDLSYNNDSIMGAVDLALQPDMGTLDWHFGYQFTGVWFESSGATGYNNFLNNVYTRGRWRFRPKTAILYEGTLGWLNYPNSQRAQFTLYSTTPITTSIGLEGLVSARVSILVMGGYAGTFTTGGTGNASVQQYDSFNGRAEIRYYPQQSGQNSGDTDQVKTFVSVIALGYSRLMQASYLSNFYGVDRGYLHADYALASRALFRLEGGVSALEHPDLYFGPGVAGGTPELMHAAYTDIRADASFYVEYRIVPSVALTGTLSYVENFSNTELPVTYGSTTAFYDQSFRDFEAFAGIRWFM